MILPQYPVYVISKGRYEMCLTAKFLIADKVPFHLVVEPQEAEEYIKRYGQERILVLPFSNLGLGSIPARNWCWEHSKAEGHEKHWIFDDNIRQIRRIINGKRIPCASGPALKCTEDFVNRYENIAIAGLAYTMFATGHQRLPAFYLNVHVYSCLLIQNSLQQRWRGRYNEDTDICLQVLSAGLCTVLINAFLIEKMATLTMKGGNMESLYKGDGRLKMARSLERVWPRVVRVGRRFSRPQHIVHNRWNNFDTQLKLKPGVNLSQFSEVNEYGLKLTKVREIKTGSLDHLLEKNDKIPGK